MDKLFIKADKLLEDSFKLAWEVYESGYRPNYIIGVWRGGAPVGIAVQEFLDVLGVASDHIAIRTSYYTGIDKRDKNVKVYGLNYMIKKLQSKDSLLIVDDVHDTGLSIEQVISDLKEACEQNIPEIRIATPYFKPTKNKTNRKPDYYIHETDKWDEVFVAIGWTFSFRKEIYDSVNDRWEQDQKTKDKEIEYIYNEKLYSLNMRNHILLLQYFFKSNNIKYHFHIAFGENPSNYTSDTLVDESHFLDISFMDFIRSLDNTFFDGRIIRWDGSEMSGFNRHPTENEHILWAKKLYNEIQI